MMTFSLQANYLLLAGQALFGDSRNSLDAATGDLDFRFDMILINLL